MIPDEHLTKTAVFHITHVENLASILQGDRLCANNYLKAGKCGNQRPRAAN